MKNNHWLCTQIFEMSLLLFSNCLLSSATNAIRSRLHILQILLALLILLLAWWRMLYSISDLVLVKILPNEIWQFWAVLFIYILKSILMSSVPIFKMTSCRTYVKFVLIFTIIIFIIIITNIICIYLFKTFLTNTKRSSASNLNENFSRF